MACSRGSTASVAPADLERRAPGPRLALWGAAKRIRTLLYRRPRSLRWSTRGFVPRRWPGARFSSGRATPVARCGRASRSSRPAAPSRTSRRISIPAGEPGAVDDFRMLERLVKLALWAHGGFRIHLDAPAELAAELRAHFHDTPTGRFDSEIVGERVYGHPIEIVETKTLPAERSSSADLGGHLEGCRIGFDLGGSDRKVAALIDGRVVWSEETEWDPYHQPDPAVPLERDHGFAAPRGRAPAARRRHRRQRGRRLRRQPGEVLVAVPRRAERAVREPRARHVPRPPARMERRALRRRQRR